jgi:hypothetical protein
MQRGLDGPYIFADDLLELPPELVDKAGWQIRRWNLIAIMRKNLKPNGRRQISLFSFAVDLAHQMGHCDPAGIRDFLDAAPERFFQADARLVAADDN